MAIMGLEPVFARLPSEAEDYLSSTGLLSLPTAIYEDKAGTICLTKGRDIHQITEHIDVKYHYIRDQVARGVRGFVKIPTSERAADGFTNPPGPNKFKQFVTFLGLRQLPWFA
jgi:hypothetical protein